MGYDAALLSLTVRAMRIYSVSFLLSGIAIFGSCFFTALNDGLTSAAISFLRTLVFQIAAVMLLPLIWELDGIWFNFVGVNALAAVLSVILLRRLAREIRKKEEEKQARASAKKKMDLGDKIHKPVEKTETVRENSVKEKEIEKEQKVQEGPDLEK